MADKPDSRNSINQTVSGYKNQVAGRDIIIHVKDDQDDKPLLDNPDLIPCPICGKGGIYRDADQCPRCHYSFEKERIRIQAEIQQERERIQDEHRHNRERGLHLLTLLASGALICAVFLSQVFNKGIWESLVGGAGLAVAIYGVGLRLRSEISTRIKRCQGKI